MSGDQDRVQLLIVESVLFIQREPESMLFLRPDFSVPKTGWKSCEEEVWVMPPNGEGYSARVRVELSHFNIRDPEASMDRRWRVTLGLLGIDKDEVPPGSSILGSRDLHARLRG